jgi:hypothetical protein
LKHLLVGYFVGGVTSKPFGPERDPVERDVANLPLIDAVAGEQDDGDHARGRMR